MKRIHNVNITPGPDTRSTLLGGFGHLDADGDGLSDPREATFGTNPNKKDTCGISNHCIEYNDYARYADQELFCRSRQDSVKGDASKDWAFGGAQSPNKEP